MATPGARSSNRLLQQSFSSSGPAHGGIDLLGKYPADPADPATASSVMPATADGADHAEGPSVMPATADGADHAEGPSVMPPTAPRTLCYSAFTVGYFQNAHTVYASMIAPPAPIAQFAPTARATAPATKAPIGDRPT